MSPLIQVRGSGARTVLQQSLSDEEAMGRVAVDGDREAFAFLVARWQRPLARLCFRLTGDWQEAEDLVQESFTRLYQARGQFRATGRFSTYLWRIALNQCCDAARRRRPTRLPEELDVVSGISPPDDLAVQREQAEQIRQAVARLPYVYRTVLVLRHYQQLKLHEIASVLEIPHGTVCSRLAEALRRMARALGPTR